MAEARLAPLTDKRNPGFNLKQALLSRRFPLKKPVFDHGDDQIDDEDEGGKDDQPGKDAGGIEDPLGLGDDVTQAPGRPQVFTDHGPDQGHADTGMQAGQNPAHGRGQEDMTKEVPFIGPEHTGIVQDVRIHFPDPMVGFEEKNEERKDRVSKPSGGCKTGPEV